GLLESGEAPDDRERDALALGALLAGYVIGSTGYGLHHVVSQTLARSAGLAHGTANAVMLPHSIGALRRRSPAAIERLDDALGGDAADVARRVAALCGAERLGEAGVAADALERYAAEAATRPELALTPPSADAA